MIKKLSIFSLFFLLFSCSNLDFVLEDNDIRNRLKNKTTVVVSGYDEVGLKQELLSFFNNKINGEFFLTASITENKENRVVKKNQVAEKIDYKLIINYDIYYKEKDCTILTKKIVSKFSFVPKSFGYNFATDRSLERLYKNSIRGNIQELIKILPQENTCML